MRMTARPGMSPFFKRPVYFDFLNSQLTPPISNSLSLPLPFRD